MQVILYFMVYIYFPEFRFLMHVLLSSVIVNRWKGGKQVFFYEKILETILVLRQYILLLLCSWYVKEIYICECWTFSSWTISVEVWKILYNEKWKKLKTGFHKQALVLLLTRLEKQWREIFIHHKLRKRCIEIKHINKNMTWQAKKYSRKFEHLSITFTFTFEVWWHF